MIQHHVDGGLTYFVNFSDFLPSGVTISSATVEIAAPTGTSGWTDVTTTFVDSDFGTKIGTVDSETSPTVLTESASGDWVAFRLKPEATLGAQTKYHRKHSAKVIATLSDGQKVVAETALEVLTTGNV